MTMVLLRSNIENHDGFATAAEARLQKMGELRVSEGDMRSSFLSLCRKDIRKAGQALVDVLSFAQADAGGARFVHALRPGKVDQVIPSSYGP